MLYPSSVFLAIISFFLSLDLCSADGPASPTGPSSPDGPSGWDCKFQPASGCGPDTTSPEYNACLVRDGSVSEFIQCADQKSTIGSDDDSQSISALNVLMKASTTCGKCNLGTTLSDYSRTDKSVKLVTYLCGKANNDDICCLSSCIGAREPEHSLVGICKNDVNLWDNNEISCDAGGSKGGQEGGSDSSDVDDIQGTTSSSTILASTSGQTATSTSSTSTIQTASPTPSPSNSPSMSASSSADRNVRMANILALGYLVVVLAAGVWEAV